MDDIHFMRQTAININNNIQAQSTGNHIKYCSLNILECSHKSSEYYLCTFKVDATFPAYNIFSPTVIDLDVDGGPLEVIMGTSAGSLFVFNQDGSVRTGWPVSQNTIHGQVSGF